MAQDPVCGWSSMSGGLQGRMSTQAVPTISARQAASSASKKIRRAIPPRERRDKMPPVG